MNVTHGLRRALQINARAASPRCSATGQRRMGARSATASRASRARSEQNGVDEGRPGRGADDERHGRYLELYLAVAWAAAIIVPLNVRWSVAENRVCASRIAAPPPLFVDDAFAAQSIAGHPMAIPGADAGDGARRYGLAGYEVADRCGHKRCRTRCCPTGDLAGIFYTGGTTGRSKGVMLSHGNLIGRRDERARRGAVPGRHRLPARRADVPPCGLRVRCSALLLGGGTQRRDPRVRPGRRARRRSRSTGSPTRCWCRR